MNKSNLNLSKNDFEGDNLSGIAFISHISFNKLEGNPIHNSRYLTVSIKNHKHSVQNNFKGFMTGASS